MKITFRRDPRQTGLAAVTAGPRGYAIKVDGVEVGQLHEYRGWYFYARFNGRYANTCRRTVETLDEVKAAAKAWLLEK